MTIFSSGQRKNRSAVELRSFRLLTSVSVLALTLGLIGEVHAGSYVYSVQQTSNQSITATAQSLTLFSSSAASQTAVPSGSESHGGTADTLQSYVGPVVGRPAENTFTQKGMTTPDYSRGDALLTQPLLSTASVAEAFLAGAGNSNGTGAWSISAPFTLASTAAIFFSFTYSNQLSLVNDTSPSGSVSADFTYTVNIQNSAGIILYSAAPTELNRALSLTSLGNISQASSGSILLVSSTLLPGEYTVTIAGSSHVFVNAVPEPSSYMLLVSGGLFGFACLGRRRLR
jgi:hypothetical protein